MDPQYKKMMLWVLAALVATIIAAIVIVEWTMHAFG
jgi:tetrahydromethanopterin S-methyltransferase subunit D